MESENERILTVITTLGRKYTGKIHVPNPNLRTTDLLNSATTYWKEQSGKVFDDAILLSDARLLFGQHSVFQDFTEVQIRLSKVLLFYDNFKSMGSETERRRMDTLSERAGDKETSVYALTQAMGNSFFEISGVLSGLSKQKSKSRFIPIHQAAANEILHRNGQWLRKKITLPHGFVGVNAECIESFHVTS